VSAARHQLGGVDLDVEVVAAAPEGELVPVGRAEAVEEVPGLQA